MKHKHRCFVFKCRDCPGGCDIWFVYDKQCGRFAEEDNQQNALIIGTKHFIYHLLLDKRRMSNGH